MDSWGVGVIVGAAVLYGDQIILETVLTEVIDVEWEDSNALTPLMMVIILRSFESARKLLLHGADAEGTKSCGFSAKELIFRLRDFCEEVEGVDGVDQRCEDICQKNEDYMEYIYEEFGAEVGVFFRHAFPPYADKRGMLKEFNDAIKMLGFDYGEQEHVNMISQGTLKEHDHTTITSKCEPFTLHLLAIFGYMIGMLAQRWLRHLGFSELDLAAASFSAEAGGLVAAGTALQSVVEDGRKKLAVFIYF
ncbi:hypothetical protein AYL99_04793 [Fonsecaea erecta]|uniref:Uncharacterized protein n=1 Tax=Fonsecaea erecta TaxID=1367422 RepID=A0A178ZJY4_9EURO|nr:hypothetical protein AYL99_04793 [Fonsecaea erecta]OAP59791.1 hypothetical protein AYL99_04793 [Fonsecaea erecta]